MTIVDTKPPSYGTSATQIYRTTVRVLFHEKERRQEYKSKWQQWERTQDGEIRAVEFDRCDSDDNKVNGFIDELIDGFSISWWSEMATSGSKCTIWLRFNFLSTDFGSLRNGRSIPLRLSTKTEVLSTLSTLQPLQSEVCYCLVKIYREHGAERQQSKDINNAQRSIHRLRQRTSLLEHNMRGLESGSARGKKKVLQKKMETLQKKMESTQKELGVLQQQVRSVQNQSVLNLTDDCGF